MKFSLLKRETLFQGYFRVDRYHIEHERFDGGTIGPFTREVFERGRVVALLPYDPLRDKVVLNEQFRPGPMALGDPEPWLLEIVAGVIDPGETPEEVARREAVEEAGCTITDLHLAHRFYASPGALTEDVTLYIGRTSTLDLGGTCGLPGEHEDIRVHVLDTDQALDLLQEGKMRNAAGVIALQWLALNREWLRSQWLASDASAPII